MTGFYMARKTELKMGYIYWCAPLIAALYIFLSAGKKRETLKLLLDVYSVKQMLQKIPQNSQESNCHGVIFLVNLQD